MRTFLGRQLECVYVALVHFHSSMLSFGVLAVKRLRISKAKLNGKISDRLNGKVC